MIARAWRTAGVAASLALLLAAACSAGGAADVETTVREYLRAVSEADAELFCQRIEPQLGFFSDEQNCLEVQGHQAGQRGDLAPRYRDQLLSDVTGQLLALEDMDVRGNEAVAVATIRWTGEGPDGFAELGEEELAVRLTRAEGEWRVASFSHVPGPPRDDQEAEAVAMAVRDYYEARKEGGRARPWRYATRPLSPPLAWRALTIAGTVSASSLPRALNSTNIGPASCRGAFST